MGIFALSLTAAEAVSKLSTFLWFGLGFGLLLARSLVYGANQRGITRLFAQRARQINRIGGILLIGIGTYDLWINRELIASCLASA